MKTALILLFIAITIFAAELPRTLGGLAPGESVEAYIGVLGYPSTQVGMGIDHLWSWGEGLLVKLDDDLIITEVVVTRAGKQKELGFDIGDLLAKAEEKLGKSDASFTEADGKVQTYHDAKSGLVLGLTVDQAENIAKISLTTE